MDFFVDKKRLNMSAEQVMRKAGYAYFVDPKSHEESFVRRLYGDFYPRFHLYLKEDPDRIRFNLHLDQKKASYQGAHKHNAEYSGETVEAEIIRLKQVITLLVQKG
jgi:hypothetical protein